MKNFTKLFFVAFLLICYSDLFGMNFLEKIFTKFENNRQTEFSLTITEAFAKLKKYNSENQSNLLKRLVGYCMSGVYIPHTFNQTEIEKIKSFGFKFPISDEVKIYVRLLYLKYHNCDLFNHFIDFCKRSEEKYLAKKIGRFGKEKNYGFLEYLGLIRLDHIVYEEVTEVAKLLR